MLILFNKSCKYVKQLPPEMLYNICKISFGDIPLSECNIHKILINPSKNFYISGAAPGHIKQTPIGCLQAFKNMFFGGVDLQNEKNTGQ